LFVGHVVFWLGFFLSQLFIGRLATSFPAMALVEVAEPEWVTWLQGTMDFTKEFLAKFSTKTKLGQGSFGKVVWARSTKNEVRWTCAVKLMESKVDDKKWLAYWANESHIWKTLCPHPNIIQLHEVYYGKVEGQQKVAMTNELVDRALGEFLTYYVCVDLEDARAWTLDLCTGLGHMHGHHIAHRDMKPANCLLKHQPGAPTRLVIGDFGQAAVLRREEGLDGKGVHRSLNSSPCTWEYAAPEVVRQRGYDFKLDVWSSGAILWQMLQAPI